jgi:hypothetical protein
MRRNLFPTALALLWLTGCQQGSDPVLPPETVCDDPSVLKMSRPAQTAHRFPKRVKGQTTTISGIQWTKGDSVRAFFGGKDVKLVFTLNRDMYLVTYAGGDAVVTRISQGDESVGGEIGSINSPLFSPDGRRIVYPGTILGKPVFILDAVAGEKEVWRVPLDPRAHVTADPHWFVEGGKTWIYFATLAGLVRYEESCKQLEGNTYKVEVLGDTLLSPIETTGVAGAYRGGISKDGKWLGSSYATTALFDVATKKTSVLAGKNVQQCNSSMNPYPPGSQHTDYMMVLGFGRTPYLSIEGDTLNEESHENLWIFNRNDKVVWKAQRPDTVYYRNWNKPEWSTHPEYATAVAIYATDESKGDLIVLNIGNLANGEEGKLHKPVAFLKIAKGEFTPDSYSHLWVSE